MKNKNIALASALVVGGLLTFNTIAFADTTNATDATTAASQKQKPAQAGQMFPGKGGAFGHRGEKGMLKGERQDWSTQLKELVAAGTIAQDSADKILAYINEQDAARKAEMEKLQSMTQEERKAYFESKKPEAPDKKDLFGAMVEKGVITQEQADAIRAKQHADMQAKQQESLKTSLNQLVEKQTITQEQAAKIIEYMNKEQADRTAEMEKVKAMTAEEGAAYFKSNAGLKVNLFTQLVNDKVLTQEQADAAAKALHGKGPGHDMQRGPGAKAPRI